MAVQRAMALAAKGVACWMGCWAGWQAAVGRLTILHRNCCQAGLPAGAWPWSTHPLEHQGPTPPCAAAAGSCPCTPAGAGGIGECNNTQHCARTRGADFGGLLYAAALVKPSWTDEMRTHRMLSARSTKDVPLSSGAITSVLTPALFRA